MKLHTFSTKSEIRYADSRPKTPLTEEDALKKGEECGILGTPCVASCIIHSRLDTANILSHVI